MTTLVVSRDAASTIAMGDVTVTAKVRDALFGGKPLSVTRTVMALVFGACANNGFHENTPFEELTLAPAGKPASSEKTSASAGPSGSDATFVKLSVVPA